MPISIKLDVKKIEKDRLYQGKKCLYLDLMLWEAEGESAEYGDFIVKQKGEKGDKLPILGNASWVDFNKKGKNNKRSREDNDEEIPF